MLSFLNSFRRREFVGLLLIWLIALACNLTKAVHMDDTVHLYAARTILENPLRPYSSEILWGAVLPGPISDITQPPLLFYGLAMVMAIFGESEIALHGFASLFTLGLILCFYQIASLFDRGRALLATALLCLSPAILPSQNLMTDVPVLFFHVFFFWIVLRRWEQSSETKDLIAAGAIVGAACLTKYVGLVLIPLFFITILLRKNWRRLWLGLVPLAVLAAWAGLSYFDTGKAHLLQPIISSIGESFYSNSVNWLVCLGALVPFSFLFIPELLQARSSAVALLTLVALSLFWSPELLAGPAPDRWDLTIVARLFLFNGLFTSLGTLVCLTREIRKTTAKAPEVRTACILAAFWFVGSFFFIGLFSRFLAVRHVLLVLPVVVLALAHGVLGRRSVTSRATALFATVSLGLLLAISDWQWADLYRNSAKEIAQEYSGEKKIWAVGHWGWQWYSEQNGMKLYHWKSKLQNDDILVVPSAAHRHPIHPDHNRILVRLAEISKPASTFTLFRTHSIDPWGGFYSSAGNSLPFRLSREPLERFSIFQVQKILNTDLDVPLTFSFADEAPKNVVLQGFHRAEYWGRWVGEQRASINFAARLPRAFRLSLQARLFPPNSGKLITLKVGDFETFVVLSEIVQTVFIDVKTTKQARAINFEFPYLSSADELSGGLDRRLLGFGLEQIEISALPLEQLNE